MVIKPQALDVARTAVSRAEVREALIELWAQVLERELREVLAKEQREREQAALEAKAEASPGSSE
jgi:DNA-binding transcriptional regulator YbjK